jgi:hypothetical protein
MSGSDGTSACAEYRVPPFHAQGRADMVEHRYMQVEIILADAAKMLTLATTDFSWIHREINSLFLVSPTRARAWYGYFGRRVRLKSLQEVSTAHQRSYSSP